MQYLVFDIECCDGQTICEFGYVVANEELEPIEKGCMLINPAKPFNLHNRSRSKGIDLHFEEKEYRNSPKFPVFYERIKDILEAKDRKVIGFSTHDDVNYLAVACDRYGLKRINFEYADSQIIYAVLFGDGKRASLEKTAEALSLSTDDIALHCSVDDALLTLRVVKKMCSLRNADFEELNQRFIREREQSRRHIEDVRVNLGDMIKQKGISLAATLDPQSDKFSD